MPILEVYPRFSMTTFRETDLSDKTDYLTEVTHRKHDSVTGMWQDHGAKVGRVEK